MNTVLENRQKWIAYLKRPDTQKMIHHLDGGEGVRCCLGHACHVLGYDLDRNFRYLGEHEWMPAEGVEALGLWDKNGSNPNRAALGPWTKTNLAFVNDETDATPQEIGAYLETVIDGGPHTPFKPL